MNRPVAAARLAARALQVRLYVLVELVNPEPHLFGHRAEDLVTSSTPRRHVRGFIRVEVGCWVLR